MARVCKVCGKGNMSGNNRSHSNRATRTSWAPNLHKVKLDGAVKKEYVCAACVKTSKKSK